MTKILSQTDNDSKICMITDCAMTTDTTMIMEELLLARDKLRESLADHARKKFNLENSLIQIEKQLATFSDNLILENLKLSDQQNQIVNATEDNILVVACPGSGKTHTLISRYVHLILENRVLAEQTLLITFTKKAGMEMLNRLNNIIPHKIPYHVGSLHGLGYKVLHEYYGINYTVLDEKDVFNYLRDLIEANSLIQQLDNEIIGMIKSKIQSLFDQASTMHPFNLKPVLDKNQMINYYKEISQIWKSYQQKKKKENLVDFNDLMLLFVKFLGDPISDDFKSNIKYVFFDEYQDVNPIQNVILDKLTSGSGSKIMVVGDDAQAIYSFRGSSVKYILNFNKTFNNPTKTSSMYLLEENYRSTPAIVNFCQDIISHNSNQYAKTVISSQDKNGFNPCIYGFKTQKEQYEWIVNDIIEKNKQGVKYSDMVILSRKNTLLNEIELYLMGNKIPTIKHIGTSLLDKSHIKDFLAWVTILTNPKSSLHWKRVIGLYQGFGINKANEIIDSSSNILESIKLFINSNPNHNQLLNLIEIFDKIKKTRRDIDKARIIIGGLEKLWIGKKESNIQEKIADINNLLNYLSTSTLEHFITDLYLNQEVETNLDNLLYLTTIHGAKGLEWSHVYIIDMDNKNFPLTRPKFYIDELDEMDEERRLFYVAASRAKKHLTITLRQDVQTHTYPSPLIREINPELYTGCGLILDKLQPCLAINKHIHNYLKIIGFGNIWSFLYNLPNKTRPFVIPAPIPIDLLIGKNFINFLVRKMIQINFPKKIKKFNLELSKDTVPQKIYLDYIDPQNDWRNILEHIYFISTLKYTQTKSSIELKQIQEFLISQPAYNYYLELEKALCKLINGLKPKEIHIHYGIGLGDVKGDIDILCVNCSGIHTIIEIKLSNQWTSEIATVSNLTQALIYGYLLKKKGCDVGQIIFLNPIIGILNSFTTRQFNWIKFKKTLYS
jgi:DNA helicase-2/ATP-dependent DNA helicase PcrA